VHAQTKHQGDFGWLAGWLAGWLLNSARADTLLGHTWLDIAKDEPVRQSGKLDW
jgi:hypothetical protein